MASGFAFGAYISATSPIHVLNAQVKIVLACVFSIVVFLVDGWVALGLLTLLTAFCYMLAKINIAHALRGLVPVAFILVFTIVVHTFSFSVGTQSSPAYGGLGSLGLAQEWAIAGTFGVTLDGFVRGLYFALRIALLVAICSLLTFTTSLVALTDGMLKLLSPLRRLRVPIDDIAMMISIALRFIPTTAEEAQTIQLAQKARCADFDNGNVIVRMRAWAPVVIPLFVRLFRRADDLARAMDARCYAGGIRTHMYEARLRPEDIVVLVCGLCCLTLLAVFL